MSGGITEAFNLKEIRNSLSRSNQASSSNENVGHQRFWELIVGARKKKSVIGCSIDVNALSLKTQFET